MSRILGWVENPHFLQAPLYFVHDSTSGYSLPPLFRDRAVMWDIWDKNEDRNDLFKAVPALSKTIMVVGVSFAYGRQIDPNGETFDEPTYGLATADRLISSSQFNDRDLSLLEVGGVLHIAEEVDGGLYSAVHNAPLCMERYRPATEDRTVDLAELYDKPLSLCPACVAAVTGS